MMRLISLVLVITWLAGNIPAANGARQRQPDAAIDKNPWECLHHKTGWIILGVVTAESRTWAAGEPSFEIIGRRQRAGTVRLPKRGDRIRLIAGHLMWILDFQIAGEKNRFRSPTTRRRTETSDFTGLTLPTGSELVVYDIQTERPAGGLRGVWVRVGPVAYASQHDQASGNLMTPYRPIGRDAAKMLFTP